MRYQFDWDPVKEKQNVRKHKISFRQAATVFRDPNQRSMFDIKHSEEDDRWLTLGIDSGGVLRVVVHTYKQVQRDLGEIRIISARKATAREAAQYNKEF